MEEASRCQQQTVALHDKYYHDKVKMHIEKCAKQTAKSDHHRQATSSKVLTHTMEQIQSKIQDYVQTM
jgi:hypothetical protein